MSARPVFIGCGNCDVCGGHWTRSQLLRSFMPSLRPASTTVTYCWLGHWRLRLTSYSVSWMRLLVLSVTLRSSIADWRSLCMSTSIGSTCRSEWNTNSCRWCISPSTRKLLSTWRTAAFQSLMWSVDDIFVPPVVITWLCRDTISARTVVGHSLLLPRPPGTHWVTICVIRRLALTVSDVYSRLVCFQSTRTPSALEVLHSMRYINLRFTYLLTCYNFLSWHLSNLRWSHRCC